MQVYQWDAKQIAKPDESGNFICGITIDGARGPGRLAGHYPGRPPAKPGEPDYHIWGKVLHQLEEVAIIHDLQDYIVHVEGDKGLLRDKRI